MATFPRTSTNIVGTPGSPATIAAGAGQTSTAFTIGSSVASADFSAIVVIGATAPSTNPTLQWEYSLDGTNYVFDDRYGLIIVPITVVSTSYFYSYSPPRGAQGVQLVATNGTGNCRG
jgi:hypothetical protein